MLLPVGYGTDEGELDPDGKLPDAAVALLKPVDVGRQTEGISVTVSAGGNTVTVTSP